MVLLSRIGDPIAEWEACGHGSSRDFIIRPGIRGQSAAFYSRANALEAPVVGDCQRLQGRLARLCMPCPLRQLILR
jgi:hypothetical protein